ncbi:MAG: hypothetical protein HQL32_04130 [Planctomycetes bacterium]|nr:hypothetical protein [Planctomycetota bacterium]
MFSIYLITLKQLLRHSTIWYINLFAIVSSELAPPFAELFTFGRVELAVIDAVQACVYVGILLSAINACYALMGKELNEKVALTLFTKPLSMHSFVLGKYWALLSCILIVCMVQSLWMYKQAFVLGWSNLGFMIALMAIYSVFCQGVILLSLAVFLTASIGPLLGIFTLISLWLIGYIVPQSFLPYICWAVPPFKWYDLSPVIYEGRMVSGVYLLLLGIFALAYSSFCVILAARVLKRKEF